MSCIALGLVQVPAHNLGLWWRLLRSSIRVAVRGQVVVALLDQGPLAHSRCRVERSVPQHYPASLHKHFVTFFLDDVLVGGDVAVVALVDDLLGALLLLALLLLLPPFLVLRLLPLLFLVLLLIVLLVLLLPSFSSLLLVLQKMV